MEAEVTLPHNPPGSSDVEQLYQSFWMHARARARGSLRARVPTLVPSHPAPPGRRSPAQLLDLQILTRSRNMARRWLRSPRIRNTFMVPPAASRAASRRELPGNFLERRALPRPRPRDSRCPRPVPRLPARAPAACTLSRAVTWRGGQEPERSQEAELPTSPRRWAGRFAQRLLAYALSGPALEPRGPAHPQKAQS